MRATVATSNGYALCSEHFAKWQAGGWDGRGETMTAEEIGETFTGYPVPMECADCEDEAAAISAAATEIAKLSR